MKKSNRSSERRNIGIKHSELRIKRNVYRGSPTVQVLAFVIMLHITLSSNHRYYKRLYSHLDIYFYTTRFAVRTEGVMACEALPKWQSEKRSFNYVQVTAIQLEMHNPARMAYLSSRQAASPAASPADSSAAPLASSASTSGPITSRHTSAPWAGLRNPVNNE